MTPYFGILFDMEERELLGKIKRLRQESKKLATSSDDVRKRALILVAEALESNKDYLFAENGKDLENARKNGISDSLYHRLVFSEEKLSSVVKGLHDLALLPDPIGRIREKRELDPGFVLEKAAFPLGVIGMIFEARPDALVQIAGLALRSGNGVILKGGKEAQYSNRALIEVIKKATEKSEISDGWILGIESHADVDALLKAEGDVDLLIPRGSNAFVKHVMNNTSIPVMGHADGICSVYVDKCADLSLAVKVVTDSKVQYPAACNAAETILIHEDVYKEFLPLLKASLDSYGVVIHGDDKTREVIEAIPATDADYHTEYLALECAIKVVSSIDEALDHIASHGSHHTDAIITKDKDAESRFFREVDSADVFSNCSTRFADGFRFGLGAEVGISTSKLHARGPVGLDGLTTTKWLLRGNGETVREYSGKDGKSFHHKELI